MQENGKRNINFRAARQKHLWILEELQEARMARDQARSKTRKSKLQGLINQLRREAKTSLREITELKHQGRR